MPAANFYIFVYLFYYFNYLFICLLFSAGGTLLVDTSIQNQIQLNTNQNSILLEGGQQLTMNEVKIPFLIFHSILFV